MVKMTLKFFLILVLVACGSLGVDQAVAAQDQPVPTLFSDEQAQPADNQVFGLNGAVADGNDGDPDSAGTGLGFMGSFVFDGYGEEIEPDGKLWNEMLRIWLENLASQP